MASAAHALKVAKPLAHLACALPLAALVLGIAGVEPFRLGANPGLAIRDELGEWGLRLLLATLAMTPLRQLTGRPWPLAFRRLLGLWSFAYVALHFVTYFVFDRASVAAIVEDVIKRPYITIGFAAFVLMIPLAVTSTAGWRRELGPRWTTLHRLVYPVAALGCWHYWWLVKRDITEPAVHAGILALLLLARVVRRQRTA
jgi:sulfoxide reductase heme-binding subunit YedZ